jgi:pantoate--beta-alanine ligase
MTTRKTTTLGYLGLGLVVGLTACYGGVQDLSDQEDPLAADALALSSRNARLSGPERAQATAIPRALRAGLAAWQGGGDAAGAARAGLSSLEIDYADVAVFDGEPTLVVAVRIGPTRLIDNVPLNQPALAGL